MFMRQASRTKVSIGFQTRLLIALGIGLFGTLVAGLPLPARADDPARGQVFASSRNVPDLQYPEGITSWNGKVYVATYNFAPNSARVLVFDAETGQLLRSLGGHPGEELISAGALLGLTIDRQTGDLYVAANVAGQILRVRHPDCDTPQISVYSQYPSGGGPEDLVFNQSGTLFATDSNLGQVYSIPPGGGAPNLVIGPAGSGAPVSDNGLFAQPGPGLSPNGIVFSLDWRTLFVANTYSDTIIAFNVTPQGRVTGPARVFASYPNHDLEEYPYGFEILIRPDTHYGASASTPVNGPDGLALDSLGRLWVASINGDNLTVLNQNTGAVVRTFGKSAVTQHGIMNNPAGMTFVGETVYAANLGIFTDGSNPNPVLPWNIASFDAGVTGAGGNGNH